ncbi:hypothetical protein EAI_16709, partial [Harpegnathos saltator]
VDGEVCNFRIDTGSDISLLSGNLVKTYRQRFPVRNYFLKYPTGEEVIVYYKVLARVDVGRHKVEFPFFVADISDDCILGVHFLKKIQLEEIFEK